MGELKDMEGLKDMKGLEERIYLHIPLVILPLDEFTGKVIKSPDFRVLVEGAGRPFIKPEGYRIFMGELNKEVSVALWGRGYQEMKIKVSLAALKHKNPVVKIYVKPGRDYLFPAGTVYMTGKLPEHSVLLAAGMSCPGAGKLRLDCKEGDDTLAVYQKTPKDIDGMTYLLADRRGETGKEDWAELLAATDFEGGVYLLKEPLCYNHPRARTGLFPAVRHVSDLQGEAYFIAIPAEEGLEKISVHCCLERDGYRQTYTFGIKAGETLYQDF